jgi:hypothetical protein
LRRRSREGRNRGSKNSQGKNTFGNAIVGPAAEVYRFIHPLSFVHILGDGQNVVVKLASSFQKLRSRLHGFAISEKKVTFVGDPLTRDSMKANG